MKQIANKWRYQNCDRFDNPKEYDFRNRDEGDLTEKDKENAIAIASLLETFTQSKKNNVVTGIRVETADYLNQIRKQMERLYVNVTHDKKYFEGSEKNIGLDVNWYKKDLTGNVQWAKKTLKENNYMYLKEQAFGMTHISACKQENVNSFICCDTRCTRFYRH